MRILYLLFLFLSSSLMISCQQEDDPAPYTALDIAGRKVVMGYFNDPKASCDSMPAYIVLREIYDTYTFAVQLVQHPSMRTPYPSILFDKDSFNKKTGTYQGVYMGNSGEELYSLFYNKDQEEFILKNITELPAGDLLFRNHEKAKDHLFIQGIELISYIGEYELEEFKVNGELMVGPHEYKSERMVILPDSLDKGTGYLPSMYIRFRTPGILDFNVNALYLQYDGQGGMISFCGDPKVNLYLKDEDFARITYTEFEENYEWSYRKP